MHPGPLISFRLSLHSFPHLHNRGERRFCVGPRVAPTIWVSVAPQRAVSSSSSSPERGEKALERGLAQDLAQPKGMAKESPKHPAGTDCSCQMVPSPIPRKQSSQVLPCPELLPASSDWVLTRTSSLSKVKESLWVSGPAIPPPPLPLRK